MTTVSSWASFIGRFAALGLLVALALAYLFPDWVNSGQTTALGRASYSTAVDRIAPAVVNVYTTRVITETAQARFTDPYLRRFFGNPPINRTRQRLEPGLGSGVIVDSDGHILTNHHVIADAADIRVKLQDGRTARVSVVGTDPDTDLAVLKLDADGLPVAEFGDPANTRVGDVVLAIGNPFGIGQTVTMGIVSATGRNQLYINPYEDFLQTDAAINAGNSGGALTDVDGKLVGINTAIFGREAGAQGIGFAIPADLAEEVMTQLIERGEVVRGWLGIVPALVPVVSQSDGRFRLMDGVLVQDVRNPSPAATAGLRPGDVITDMDGQAVSDRRELLDRIARTPPGQNVTFGFLRGESQLSATATLQQRARN